MLIRAVACAAAVLAAASSVAGMPGPAPVAASALPSRGPSVLAFPGPGVQTASPRTTIVFRGVAPAALGALRVVGSRSGVHHGRTVGSRVGAGAVFVPRRPFLPGEDVSVTSDVRVSGASSRTYHFSVAVPAAAATPPGDPVGSGQQRPGRMTPARSGARSVHNCLLRKPSYKSRPDLHPVADCVSRPAGHTAAGYLFTTPNPTSNDQHGPTIYDNRGQVVWYQPFEYRRVYDLTVVTYRGRRMLAFYLETPRPGTGGYRDYTWVLYNDHYQQVAAITAHNGYEADGHELQIRGRHAWLGAYVPVVDPVSHRQVYEYVVQEIDVPTDELLFEWHSLPHVPASASYKPPPAGDDVWDYFHGNAIAPLSSGGFLLSARNTSAIYRIGPDGRVDWVMGGKDDQFGLVGQHPDWQFCFQHDVRKTGPHQLSVFDNGGRGPGCPRHQARVEQFSYDVAARTVQRTAKYSSYYASGDGRGYRVFALGSARYLSNGDLIVSWGQTGRITEFSPKHHVDFDLTLAKHTYRAVRWRWFGDPRGKPAVVADRSGHGVSVYASWNGSTRVVRWQVLAGNRRSALHPVGKGPRTGFETRIRVRSSAAWIAVRAINRNGHVLGTSAVVRTS